MNQNVLLSIFHKSPLITFILLVIFLTTNQASGQITQSFFHTQLQRGMVKPNLGQPYAQSTGTFYVGNAAFDQTNRGYIVFNISGIPSNATVTAATLNLRPIQSIGNTSSSTSTILFKNLANRPPHFNTEADWTLLNGVSQFTSLTATVNSPLIISTAALKTKVQNSLGEGFFYFGLVNASEAAKGLSFSTTNADLFLSVTYTIPVPAAPTNLQASNITTTGCTLTWLKPPGSVSGYRIYKNDVLSQTSTTLSAIIQNLTPNTSYSFKVSAYNDGGESPRSNAVNITTLPDPITNNFIYFPSNNYNNYSYTSTDVPNLTGSIPQGSPTFTYKWQMSNNGSTWSDISGATSKDHDPPVIFQTTHYRRIVNSTNVSNTRVVYIYPPIGNNTICCNQTVTNPTPANPITGTTPSGGSPQKITGWQSSTDGLNWVGVSGLDEYQPPGGQSGIKFYRRVVSDQAGENISNVVQINFINVIPIGSSFENPFPVGTYNSPDCSYFTQTTNSLDGNFSNQYGDSRNDLFFSFQVNYPHGFPFGFTTCNSGVDTKLYLLDSNENIIASAENGTWLTLGCGQNSQEADFTSGQLFAGQYYLVVEGNGNLNVNIATALYSDCFDQYPLPFSSIADESNSPLTRASPQGEDINNDVNLYPNPVIDNVSVSGITDFDVTLYDQSAMSWHVLSHQNGIIDLSGLKKGYYIIKLKNQDQTIIKRIAKE